MIKWRVPPSRLVAGLRQYERQVEQEIVLLAQEIAKELVQQAKADAPWQDRTGDARRGLAGSVEYDAAKALVTIYLSHHPDVFYGVFLELANAQRFAVIIPTIQRMFPEIERRLKTNLKYGRNTSV